MRVLGPHPDLRIHTLWSWGPANSPCSTDAHSGVRNTDLNSSTSYWYLLGKSVTFSDPQFLCVFASLDENKRRLGYEGILSTAKHDVNITNLGQIRINAVEDRRSGPHLQTCPWLFLVHYPQSRDVHPWDKSLRPFINQIEVCRNDPMFTRVSKKIYRVSYTYFSTSTG